MYDEKYENKYPRVCSCILTDIVHLSMSIGWGGNKLVHVNEKKNCLPFWVRFRKDYLTIKVGLKKAIQLYAGIL